MKDSMQEVRIWIPNSLLETIDKAVKKAEKDRAEFIREAIFEKIEHRTSPFLDKPCPFLFRVPD